MSMYPPPVQTVLTLPVTSNAFTALPPSDLYPSDTGSPPHKTPRLDLNTDTGTRKRTSNTSPVHIQVIGDHGFAGLRAKSEAEHARLTNHLRQCIRMVLSRDPSTTGIPHMTYESIYLACRTIVCVAHGGEALYNILQLEVDKSVSELAGELMRIDPEERQPMLAYVKTFVDACQWFETQVALLRSLLTYLDQIFVLKLNPSLLTIRDRCFNSFTRIFLNPQITTRVISNIRDWVTYERNSRSENKNRIVISSFISHLMTHGHYPLFEDTYLEDIRVFYKTESDALALQDESSGTEFFKKASVRVEEEIKRAKELLPQGSWDVVRKETQWALYGDRLEWLAKTTLPVLIEKKDIYQLTQMFNIFSHVDRVRILCAAFKAHLELSVREIVTNTARDDDMIDRLLEHKSFIDTVVQQAFSTRPGTPAAADSTLNFGYARSDGFAAGFAARPNKPAELLAKRLDREMRKGQRAQTDAQFAQALDDVLALYSSTKDKDVFRAFYTKALAKRLLLEKSASNDFEKAMLKKLKEQFDPEFATCNQMFTDLALSKDKMNEYHEKASDSASAQKLNVMVLQRSVWPFAVREKKVDLPLALQDELTRYERFYKTKHKNHMLYWDHALGTATLKARFDGVEKELTVSLYQAIVLLLFNDADELMYADILEQTRMAVARVNRGDSRSTGDGDWVPDEQELKRTLQSLACGKKRVLKKDPAGREIDVKDVFRFNADFTDLRHQVHINSIQAKETAEETNRTQTSVEEDRRHFLDAAIVRVMKARKELSNEELKAATIEAVKNHFVPDVKAIKQRIEMMVEQEYLRRDEDDLNLFIYVA